MRPRCAVAENTTAVTTVVASDADGANPLTYSISAVRTRRLFAIDATTGVLSFVAAPDFESRRRATQRLRGRW